MSDYSWAISKQEFDLAKSKAKYEYSAESGGICKFTYHFGKLTDLEFQALPPGKEREREEYLRGITENFIVTTSGIVYGITKAKFTQHIGTPPAVWKQILSNGGNQCGGEMIAIGE